MNNDTQENGLYECKRTDHSSVAQWMDGSHLPECHAPFLYVLGHELNNTTTNNGVRLTVQMLVYLPNNIISSYQFSPTQSALSEYATNTLTLNTFTFENDLIILKW